MAETKKYYTYVYAHPLTADIFYVGKGCGDRSENHLKLVLRGKRPNGRNYPLYKEIREILNGNMQPLIIRLNNFGSSEDAFKDETSLIQKYKSEGYNLLNLTNGGDGFDSESVSISSKKRWANPEYKAKMTKIIREFQNTEEYKSKRSLFFKKLWSNPEYKERLSKIAKVTQNLPERKKKQSIISKERNNLPEVKAKFTKEIKARWANDEYKIKVSKKISESLTNNPKVSVARHKRFEDKEVRARQSILAKNRWENPVYREMMVGKIRIFQDTENYKKLQSDIMKQKWADPNFRELRLEQMKRKSA